MKLKELQWELKTLGFWVSKEGNHTTWTDGEVKVHVPKHKDINGKTAHFILKMARREDTKNFNVREMKTA